jgi:hypothetical protein
MLTVRFFRQLLVLIDVGTREVLSWRRDAYAVACGFQSVEEIVRKGKRFIEAGQ